MYIQFDNTNCQKFRTRDMPEGYYVNPNDNGVAQVKEEIGNQLVSEFDTIHEYTKE